MSFGFDLLVSGLERRFDFYSARVVAREALKSNGLDDKKEYAPDEAQTLVDHIASAGDEMDDVWVALGMAPTGTELPKAQQEAKPAEPEAKPAEEATPAEEAKPAQEAKPAEEEGEAEPEAKPAEDEDKAEPAAKKAPAKKAAPKKKAPAKKKN